MIDHIVPLRSMLKIDQCDEMLISCEHARRYWCWMRSVIVSLEISSQRNGEHVKDTLHRLAFQATVVLLAETPVAEPWLR